MDISLDVLDATLPSSRDSIKKRRILDWNSLNFDFAFRHDDMALVSECPSDKKEKEVDNRKSSTKYFDEKPVSTRKMEPLYQMDDKEEYSFSFDPFHVENHLVDVMEFKSKKVAFANLLNVHENFLQNSDVIDPFLLAMSFVYLQRAGINSWQFNSDFLFYALHLAIAMEEDCCLGMWEIICYRVGSYPELDIDKKIVPKRMFRSELEWKSHVVEFHKEKDKFWKLLDYNTYVNKDSCVVVIRTFQDHHLFKKIRKSVSFS